MICAMRHGRPSPALMLLAATGMATTDGYAIAVSDKQHAISVLAVSTVLAAVALVGSWAEVHRTTVLRGITAGAFVAFGLIQWHRTVALYGGGRWYTTAHYLALLLPALGLTLLLLQAKLMVWAWRACLAVFAVAGVAVIQCSPRPLIDVWFFLQHATRCVTHMCNPYTMETPKSPGVTHGITYFPGSFLLLTPFRLLFGDVRYGLLLALLAVAAVLRLMIPGRRGLIAGPLVLATPGTMFALEESWIEPMLLVLLLLSLLAWHRNNPLLLIVALAAAILTKQHTLLLFPLALLFFGWRRVVAAGVLAAIAALPWFVVSPSAFYDDTVRYFFDLPGRLDALSVWLLAPRQIQSVLPPVTVVALYALVWRLAPRSTAGFLMSAGLLLAGFELTNKVSFYNEWALPAMLLLAGAVAATESAQDQDHSELSAVDPGAGAQGATVTP
jgi:hypothetical protein